MSYFGSRGVFCYDFAGKEVWRQEMKPASHLGGFGTGSSVVISGNIVLLNRDQLVGSQLLALRLDNGATAWVAERPELVSSYSTPVIWPHDGREEVVVAGSLQLRAYDLQSGAETWRVRGLPPVTCTTPVLGDGILLFAGWANGKAEAALEPFEQLLEAVDKNHDAGITRVEFDTHPRWKGFYATFDTNADQKIVREEWEGARAFLTQGENCMIAVRPGTGDITEKNVIWKQKRGLPYVPSPLLHDGHVYLVKDGGLVSCFDARSGREIYLQERLGAVGTYYSSPVAASNRLYISSQEGKITVIRTGEKPERLAQADLGERLSSTPAIVGESIFYRTAHSLWKFAQQ